MPLSAPVLLVLQSDLVLAWLVLLSFVRLADRPGHGRM